ncbi:MAG: LVIVD repeat-containing protein, partial [Candidatus Hodarchaeales archaeon]
MRKIHRFTNSLILTCFVILSISVNSTSSYTHSMVSNNVELILLSETGTGGDTYDIWVDETKELAYVTCGYYGLRILNISNPSDPVLLSIVPESSAVINTGHTTAYAHQILVKDHIAYIGDGPGGLKIINCSDPENPSVITHFTEGYSWDLEIVNNVAFVANGWNNMGNPGMMVIDITNLSNPLMIYNHRDHDITDLEVSGNRLYLAGYTAGIAILDISNYSNPVLLGRYTDRDDTFDVEIKSNFLFQSSWDYGL